MTCTHCLSLLNAWLMIVYCNCSSNCSEFPPLQFTTHNPQPKIPIPQFSLPKRRSKTLKHAKLIKICECLPFLLSNIKFIIFYRMFHNWMQICFNTHPPPSPSIQPLATSELFLGFYERSAFLILIVLCDVFLPDFPTEAATETQTQTLTQTETETKLQL